MTKSLPKAFSELERWSFWSLATEKERYAQRSQSTIDELKAFCGALQPHMEDLIQYLSKFKWGTPLSDEDMNLYNLGLAYMEAVIPLDLGWKNVIAVDSFPVARMVLPHR